jgi:hypothetical protein
MLVASVAKGAEVPNPDDSYSSGLVVTICYTDEEVEALLAGYDESSATSPAATVCRPTLRAILNAVKA